VMLSPLKETVVDFLPFVGTVEAENVVYRQRMLEASVDIIWQNPWFGSTDYVAELIALDLVIGGMVDIVNTYVGVGLANGLVGLGSFMGVFLFSGLSVVRWMRRLPDADCEERTIGQGLLAALVGICLTIATVSSISFIPLMYWFVAGLCVGYPAMVKRKLNSLPATVPEPEPVNLGRGFGARPTSRPA
jgi:O-antigen ligase